MVPAPEAAEAAGHHLGVLAALERALQVGGVHVVGAGQIAHAVRLGVGRAQSLGAARSAPSPIPGGGSAGWATFRRSRPPRPSVAGRDRAIARAGPCRGSPSRGFAWKERVGWCESPPPMSVWHRVSTAAPKEGRHSVRTCTHTRHRLIELMCKLSSSGGFSHDDRAPRKSRSRSGSQ
jgi:hypothetical protein